MIPPIVRVWRKERCMSRGGHSRGSWSFSAYSILKRTAPRIVRKSGTLVIANHPSLLDVVLIMSLMRRTQCVVKPGVWNNPFMRGVIKATNYIPNLGDPERTLHDCVPALQSGNNLVIFPEGSRTVPGKPMHFERGFANIAIRAGAPIRLVTVTCNPPMLRKGEKWYQSPLRKPRYRVRVCDRMDVANLFPSDIPSRDTRSSDGACHETIRGVDCRMSLLEAELKELIVASLFLEDVSRQSMTSDEPLFGDAGLALDSIDALEIGVEIQKKYGVKIDPKIENLPSISAACARSPFSSRRCAERAAMDRDEIYSKIGFTW